MDLRLPFDDAAPEGGRRTPTHDLPCHAKHPPKFDGATYDQAKDEARLTGQALRTFELMADGKARTLREIAAAVGCSEASASARLRDFRKRRFGRHEVTRERVSAGLYRYALKVSRRLAL